MHYECLLISFLATHAQQRDFWIIISELLHAIPNLIVLFLFYFFRRTNTVIFILQERKNYRANATMTGSLDWSLLRRPLNTICFESPSHTNTLLQGFNELRNHDFLLDVTLLADGKSFKVRYECSVDIIFDWKYD